LPRRYHASRVPANGHRERASAGELLDLLADHPMVRPSPMLALAEQPLTAARGRDVAGAAR
jgi:hypothetical protein